MRSRRLIAVLCVVTLASSLAYGAGRRGAPLPPAAVPVAAAPAVSLRTQAGQLMGVAVDGQALPATRLGGFYVRPYTARTGPSVLTNGTLATLPKPLPESFSIDEQVQYNGRPTITIKQPEDQATDSGFLEFTGPVQAGRMYLLKFAHRGRRLGGEMPPILHIREYDATGKMAAPQQNIDLFAGSYDWKEETFSIPTVEGAVSLGLAFHHPAGTGQFWMSEPVLVPVKEQAAELVPGQWVPDDRGRLTFAGSLLGTEVTLNARVAERDGGLTITAVLSAPTEYLRQHPQALIVGFHLPVTATGWRWGDSLHRERTIEPGKSYSSYHLLGLRQLRLVSWFPLGAVSGPHYGLAIMAPLTPTTLNRMSYDARGSLNAEFDLGLAVRRLAPSKHPEDDVEQAAFSFDIAAYDPRWGYRAALERYYQRYPALFASSAKEGGWWIGPTGQAKDLRDFGVQYSENHFTRPEDAKANNAAGLYTCSYSEPWMWRIETLGPEVKSVSQVPPPLSLLPGVQRDADAPPTVKDSGDYWPAPRRESVRAFLNSVDDDLDGTPRVNAVRRYGATVIEFSTSCLPKIASPRWGEANRGMLSYKYETQEDQKRVAAAGAHIDGVYFDSVGDWSDISAEDPRPDHFPFSEFPLTFSYATGRPVISGLSAMAQYMQFIREKQYTTMANSDAKYAAYAAPYLDMIGAGENFAGGDEEFSQDRVVAYHKSLSILNSGMLTLPPEEAEKRFRLLLFYHIYPGLNAGDPAELEKARPVYQRYLPLMQEMGAAGWEPVPWATVDDAAVWVERYGPGRTAVTDLRTGGLSRGMFFALRNPTGEPRRVTLSIEESAVGRVGELAQELLGNRALPVQRAGDKALIRLEIPAEDTAVVQVSAIP